MESFERQLINLINSCSVENDSGTPDFILAQYLVACLDAFNKATQRRELFYNIGEKPVASTPRTPKPLPPPGRVMRESDRAEKPIPPPSRIIREREFPSKGGKSWREDFGIKY